MTYDQVYTICLNKSLLSMGVEEMSVQEAVAQKIIPEQSGKSLVQQAKERAEQAKADKRRQERAAKRARKRGK